MTKVLVINPENFPASTLARLVERKDWFRRMHMQQPVIDTGTLPDSHDAGGYFRDRDPWRFVWRRDLAYWRFYKFLSILTYMP